ncbi:uncharacterized protein LOC113645973 [Tachysurus fulvidraco]|uniref:uncharacterized protein LOC113645973 n=1 Tax=Tachysurus fulvidraco TaxID=1234273 RepID=UPI001FED6DAF|nr:uncharacterized protein LOC113645973 [Tachysurus fulvidraco]
MMMLMWITAVLFSQTGSAQKNVLHQPDSVITAVSGENVTLQCIRIDNKSTDPIMWYKQAAGHEPCVMVTVHKTAPSHIFEDEFKSQRFTVENLKESCNLKINNVEPSDEAVYYCGIKIFTIEFGKGTFLSVKDDRDVKVSVWQRGVSDSVPAGASVTLQCSVLSESRAAELQVLWFRAAPPQSHPQIIYTHHNSSRQCESDSSTHTCVYNFSKNIVSLNDTGTYYCAVLLCGKISFGNGTQILLERSMGPEVICLSVALGVCMVVIFTLTFVLSYEERNSERHKDRIQHDAVINTDETNTQVHDAVELNYAALHFNERKIKRIRGNRGPSQSSVYSEVKYSTISH